MKYYLNIIQINGIENIYSLVYGVDELTYPSERKMNGILECIDYDDEGEVEERFSEIEIGESIYGFDDDSFFVADNGDGIIGVYLTNFSFKDCGLITGNFTNDYVTLDKIDVNIEESEDFDYLKNKFLELAEEYDVEVNNVGVTENYNVTNFKDRASVINYLLEQDFLLENTIKKIPQDLLEDEQVIKTWLKKNCKILKFTKSWKNNKGLILQAVNTDSTKTTIMDILKQVDKELFKDEDFVLSILKVNREVESFFSDSILNNPKIKDFLHPREIEQQSLF